MIDPAINKKKQRVALATSEQWVYGPHAVNALLTRGHRRALQVCVQQERNDRRILDLIALAEKAQVPVEKMSTGTMDQRFTSGTHHGIVARAEPLPDYNERDLTQILNQKSDRLLILILDGVTDPHNLGACLRSADASGVDFVIIPKDKNAGITAVVSQVACGAAESVPVIRVTNLARTMLELKQTGVWIYGAAGEADCNLYNLDTSTSIALVMGSEGTGLRRLTKDHCDGLFSIPMLGSVSSLNVSVATGISLYEVVRQRQLQENIR